MTSRSPDRIPSGKWPWIFCLFGSLLCPVGVARAESHPGTPAYWPGSIDVFLSVPYKPEGLPDREVLRVVRQEYESLGSARSCLDGPLKIGTREFDHGLGTHANSEILVYSPRPIIGFHASVGVDHNNRTTGGRGSVVFSVHAGQRELYRSPILRGGEEAARVEVEVPSTHVIELRASDAGDGPFCDHADWGDALIVFPGGQTMYLDAIAQGELPVPSAPYPFSFVYGEKSSDDLLQNWNRETRTEEVDADRKRLLTSWTDPASGLRILWDVIRYSDFPAVDWLLSFENTGDRDTAILKDIQVLDLTIRATDADSPPYTLHRTNGAPSNPTDFEARTVELTPDAPQTMGGGGGRSSNRDFPFFKVETGMGSFVVAVGWSGQWQADLECPDRQTLHVTAGLELTHFLFHPGERVRMPRILMLLWEGDTLESNARFRQLIYKHYVAVKNGKKPLPTLYCNTCFTRGGGWLNECNAENQMSLIKAYAPLGLEALLTDAGWFEGGWPNGAGNWTPRKDAYPEGMGPVAACAKQHNMIYGLWFEPERVVAGTWLEKNHPEWLLRASEGPQQTYLLNFGLPAVQDYFFGIVKGFMDLPGFRVYRQDFNMDPLPYWRYSDPPDRQGITETRYIEGLYAYWDRIAAAWPDGLRIECASGGRRIDLETVTRMHVHQKSDYWFDNEVDQASIWGLSQYLPNNCFMAPINRMDDYSFHSALATSLCMGWIADAEDFDLDLGKRLLSRYREVRHYLIGGWYPLLPYSRDRKDWIACQYHRSDLDEGMVLVFRRPESRYRSIEIAFHGLIPDGRYEMLGERTGSRSLLRGSELMEQVVVELPEKAMSELLVYRAYRPAPRRDGAGTQ